MQPKTKTVNITGMQPLQVKGILINRDRPANSGWCGAEDRKHVSHKHFNSPAKSIK